MIDPRVYSICEEYGVVIVDGRSYPGIRETRAVVTLDRILSAKGEDHFRLVLSTVAETENNQGYIDKHLLWAVSDLVETYRVLIEANPSEWLVCFDRAPVGELQVVAKGLRHQRFALVGMLAERVVRRFGPNAGQGDLFDDRRAA
ncbi:hypothetical protein IB238_09155 [Rhizobium sp. ARZ01]|uniref:hypothetical protein n=1 Tax=Rhizobium sp. ARZ01 TaxID=2769313 RepID=UPI00178158DF|nr:hypothetical protein [Rhizobium sp. ARZ01]MBD9372786.1 hypothetical protein [Rhizobium sp. ARZ01]